MIMQIVLQPLLMSIPKLPAIILLAVSQKVGSVNLGVGKAAIGALCPLSVVLALGDRAVVAEAPRSGTAAGS